LVGWLAIASAMLAAIILVVHLIRKPTASAVTKLWLLMGLGVFPILSAGAANVEGFAATQSRTFCGSCHVMIPHAKDSVDPKSVSLASIHARNGSFGNANCYTCHKDYGMYGFVLTKLGGMRHVYLYLTEYHDYSNERFNAEIRIAKPMPNSTCMTCHTTTAPGWSSVPDHASSLAGVREGTLSCASAGCHGFAHPITKVGRELPAAVPAGAHP
jgi:nitrate/TMAO reductase-like tetraheme cytochrome c subunit